MNNLITYLHFLLILVTLGVWDEFGLVMVCPLSGGPSEDLCDGVGGLIGCEGCSYC
jgi:hypothetical protein